MPRLGLLVLVEPVAGLLQDILPDELLDSAPAGGENCVLLLDTFGLLGGSLPDHVVKDVVLAREVLVDRGLRYAQFSSYVADGRLRKPVVLDMAPEALRYLVLGCRHSRPP